MPPRVVYWFRTDLRLHDSPGLAAALQLDPECLYPVWTWDPHYVYRSRVGVNRWNFLLESQQDLSDSLQKLNPKSRLLVVREAPQTAFAKLFKAWKISHLVYEKDTDPYARDRDTAVNKIAEENGVTVISKHGRTLYDADLLVKENGNQPTMTIRSVIQISERLGPVSRPLPPPSVLPDIGDLSLEVGHSPPESEPDYNARSRSQADRSFASLKGPSGKFDIPTMEELGFPKATTSHRGGETEALRILTNLLKDKSYVANFQKPETAPTAFRPQSTTLLSPHLHFGSLSIRKFYWDVRDIVDYAKAPSQPPTSLVGQLLFRDMYFGAQAAIGHVFHQTEGNGHCRFVPWHLMPQINEKTGLHEGKYKIDSEEAEEWFQRWRNGRTGFPWIDAIMRQLRIEGWIHHLARHSVACFLTRGGCYISWERGAEVFEEWLIDHEPACNVGNWQWLSCTAFFALFYRCYSPVEFPKKWDKSGALVRHFCPELREFADKYIYEPWKAPLSEQRKAGCLVKGDGTQESEGALKLYPSPLFDFNERRQICMEGMKEAFKVGLYGNDPAVKDGSWRKLFSTSHLKKADYTKNRLALHSPKPKRLKGTVL